MVKGPFSTVQYSQLSVLILGLIHLKAVAMLVCSAACVPVGHLVYLTCKDSQLR